MSKEETKYCPSCGTKTAKFIGLDHESTKVGWEDGLGSPGQMHFTFKCYECTTCKKTLQLSSD